MAKEGGHTAGGQQGRATATAIGASYFYEDEVFHVGKNGDLEFGMVTENWEMYDSSDEEEDEDANRVPQGHVAVTWHPRGKEEVLPESKVKLSDRSLMPGDVVRRLIAGKDTQRGYCRNIRVSAAVQIHGSKKIITNVLASNLKSVQKMQSDTAVYLDSWIGLVRDIRYKISLRFADNSACIADSCLIGEHFEDTRQSSDGFGSGDVFYPGQKLRGQMKYLRDADWSYMSDDMKRAKDRKMVNAIVTNVAVEAMSVQWQWQTPESPLQQQLPTATVAAGGEGQGQGQGQDQGQGQGAKPPPKPNNYEKHPPPTLVTEEDLGRVTCLNLFDSCTVQLGDISFYTPSSKDVILERSDWKKLMAAGIHGPALKSAVAVKPSETKLIKDSGTTANAGIILKVDDSTAALADVDASAESDTATKTESATKTNSQHSQLSQHGRRKSLPRVSTRALRKKKLKKSRQQPKLQLVPATRIVVETVHTSSTVDVVWQDGTIEENMMSVELYPIHHLDDHEFFPGDFVIRAESTDFRTYGVIQNMDHAGRVALVKWFEAYSFVGEQRPTELQVEEMSVYDIKDHPDFRFRPGTIVIRVANMLPTQHAAGQILDNYPDGQVRVWWTNDQTSSCWPQDLFRLGDYDSDEGEMWDDNANGSGDDCEDGVESDSSWETEAEEELVESADSVNRYNSIGKLIEQIQSTLVGTRETIIATAPLSVSEDGQAVSNTNLSDSLDRRGLTKKLLLIIKDCQYLDKLMGSKFFDEKFIKDWFKEMEGNCKGGQMLEQVKRLFYSDLEKSGSSVSIKDGLKVETPTPGSGTDSSTNIIDPESGASEDVGVGDATSHNVLVSELCSVILNKLVAAHSEYESRFGNALTDSEGKILPSITEESPTAEGDEKSIVGHDKPESNKITTDKEESKDVPPSDPALPKGSGEDSQTTTDKEKPKEKEKEKEEEVEKKSSHFTLVDSVPATHRYRLTSLQPTNQRQFIKAVRSEVSKLRENLPEGIQFKGYEDRMDLYSVMISGPENTPYEDGLFFFDIQLPSSYPDSPPLVHYVSFCPDRLNPNLYECGKVCVSLLGTWSGRGTEVWTSESSLLQLLVSIQGLILVPEPYYNEAGYEKQRGSQQGMENSRMYNEMVLIKLVQSMSRMLANPHSPWEEEISRHIQLHGPRMIQRYRQWLMISEKTSANPGGAASAPNEDDAIGQPGFPLLPVSKGFSITLRKTLDNFAKQCAPSTPTLSAPLGLGFGLPLPSSSSTDANANLKS